MRQAPDGTLRGAPAGATARFVLPLGAHLGSAGLTVPIFVCAGAPLSSRDGIGKRASDMLFARTVRDRRDGCLRSPHGGTRATGRAGGQSRLRAAHGPTGSPAENHAQALQAPDHGHSKAEPIDRRRSFAESAAYGGAWWTACSRKKPRRGTNVATGASTAQGVCTVRPGGQGIDKLGATRIGHSA